MNVTVATEMLRQDFKWSHAQYEREAAKARPGSDGLVLLPYLEGERTPNVPDGTGVYFGVAPRTFTARHFARATMEGVTLGMNYGLRRLARQHRLRGRQLCKLIVPPGHCYVLGDNESVSWDSREFGCLPLRSIIGRVPL